MRVEDMDLMDRVNYSATKKAISEMRRAKDELVYASMYEHQSLEEQRAIDCERDEWIKERQSIEYGGELSPYSKVLLGAGYIVFLYCLGMIAASVFLQNIQSACSAIGG